MKLTRLNNKSGFTLIELLIVVIIVAVLAAVGIPLLQGNVARARLTEADAALGTTRTAMRSKLAENGSYPIIAAGTTVVAANIGMNAGDLCGRFFGDADYAFSALTTATTYCLRATGSGADTAVGCPTGPVRGSQVRGVVRSMNESGDIFTTNDCSGARIN